MIFTGLKYRKILTFLPQTLTISNQTIKEKPIIIIKVTDEFGKNHYGEVAPLIGFSSESIDECEKVLIEIMDRSVDNYENLKKELNKLDHLPSLKFGFEQILLSITRNKNFSFSSKAIKLNKLIGIETESQTIIKIETAHKKGFDVVKLKIGRKDFNDDLKILRIINKKFGSSLKLRLDNNGSWDFEEAKRNIEKLKEFNIEYIEQPVHDTKCLLQLVEQADIPIAPDESLRNFSVTIELIRNENIKFVVLKPTLRLGIFDSMKLIKLAKSYDVNIIITSGFESVVGRSSLLYLASITEHGYAHGLSILPLETKYFSSKIDYSKPAINALDFNLQFKEVINI